MDSEKKLKVLFMCGREPSYTRNVVLLKALRKNFDVIECTDSSKTMLVRNSKVFFKFLFKKKKVDIIFVGFYGQPLMPFVGFFTKKKIVFDAFISTYQTLCFDREKIRKDSMFGKFAYWLDKYSCNKADKVILDTNQHIDYFVRTFNLDRSKFNRVFVGADEDLFYPRDVKKDNKEFLVLFYGEFQRLHGLDKIVRAAKSLEDHSDIKFKIIGTGPEREKIIALSQELNTKNIQFIEWIDQNQLPNEIAKADLCIGGHFGDTEKADLVIPGKVFQMIAMRKPVILCDNSSNKELFNHKYDSYIVTQNKTPMLVDGILKLYNDQILIKSISDFGYNTFKKNCSIILIGNQLKQILD